jgi:hypothetical protein
MSDPGKAFKTLFKITYNCSLSKMSYLKGGILIFKFTF